jgi:acyl-CoA synthetase (NDP forming)
MLTRPSETLRQALLAPRAVALIGQSNDPAKAGGRPLQYLRQAGYGGRIYAVNAKRDTVLGERAYPSVAALPEVPEHAYVLVPTEAVIEAVAACGRAGVKVATIMASGFGEAGAEGAAREAELKRIAVETGIRIIGPSSLGVVDLRTRLMLTANAAFAEKDLPVGRIFAASQSGSMIGALVSRGKARGIGFAGLVSIGNEIDLSIGEICAATLDDPDIDSYMLFLETIRHAAALAAFAREAAARGKPVIAYKLGRSSEARELAMSHTGALAGEDDVADTFLADCGIARVSVFESLIESPPLVARVKIPEPGARPPAVAVVTTTAGGAAMVVDALALRGVRIEEPSAETLARLAAKSIEVAPARLIDLTIAGARYDVMKGALDVLTTAGEFDLVVAVVGSSARFHPELAVKPIIDSRDAQTPIAAFLVPEAPDALLRLQEAGIPSFRTPEACADAIAAAYARRVPRASYGAAQAEVPSHMLDELEAYALLDRLGIPHAPAVPVDGDAPELPFGYPVAAKILSAEIAHKSDVGGVRLDIGDREALGAALREIRSTVAERSGKHVERVLVAPMIGGLGEALVGYRIDREVGPLVMIAAGGLFTEIHRDRSIRLAPVDLATARAMIREVRGLRALAGARGRAAGDLEALAQAVVALSRLAEDPNVIEAEVNPLIVRADGVVAVDCLVRVSGGDA